ncbi:hypothetical protein J6590_008614 [Homalodisca vitripennis]|nr:hypothetical protein J6590_008614 [Homalodisca vitripennis]
MLASINLPSLGQITLPEDQPVPNVPGDDEGYVSHPKAQRAAWVNIQYRNRAPTLSPPLLSVSQIFYVTRFPAATLTARRFPEPLLIIYSLEQTHIVASVTPNRRKGNTIE